MELQISSTKVLKVHLDSDVKADVTEKTSFNLKFKPFPIKDKGQEFVIEFDIEIQEPDFCLKVNYHVRFACSEILKDDFIQSDFVKINAPAIAFPLLRSFIATLTLHAGYKAIFLPSINFESLSKQDKGK